MTKRRGTFQAYTVSLDGLVRYVGITTRGISKRWREHCQPTGESCSALKKAIRKYGAAAFVVTHVASAWDADSLCDLERLLISQFGTFGDLNLTTGGRADLVRAPSTRERISERLSRWNADPVRRREFGERVRQWFAIPANRAAVAERIRARDSTPEAKLRQSQRTKAFLANPQKLAAAVQKQIATKASPEWRSAASARIKAHWIARRQQYPPKHPPRQRRADGKRSSPRISAEQRLLINEKLSAAALKRWQNMSSEERARMSSRFSTAATARNSRPEVRERLRNSLKQYFSTKRRGNG